MKSRPIKNSYWRAAGVDTFPQFCEKNGRGEEFPQFQFSPAPDLIISSHLSIRPPHPPSSVAMENDAGTVRGGFQRRMTMLESTHHDPNETKAVEDGKGAHVHQVTATQTSYVSHLASRAPCM
jgi:hypothetical protein